MRAPSLQVIKDIRKDYWLYLMAIPGILYFIIFKYLPMGGVIIAFQDFHPFSGFLGSKWVGLKHFERLVTDMDFWMLLRNTLMLSVFQLVFAFPAPIIIAIMLNEIRKEAFKRSIQTIIYIPHFMSWVVVVSMFFIIFESERSLLQSLLSSYGVDNFTIMMSEKLFRPMYILQVIWRDTGWGTIIYLAALSAISPELYEAARMDGASRIRQIWHVTLPGIRSTIVILFLLKLSDILETSFEHVYVLVNSLNREVAEVFDTYVYRVGIESGQLSYATSVGLFKGLIGLLLVVMANRIAKKLGEEGLY
ncbi:putative multiple-sugar transport system permease YteP [Paenibacillus nasutitermitis]|uniref:Multiple-sugar transport system permease YteP n=2 Tax=Paenibacillus nasutitermitis TaxID=1652958 RepID=A0A916YMV7_9BACL|nr:ABC transporter permease subunit [Paenibacillus nasutitermitis]GGD52209.1 putative multiple-sugar transport system permease YteP [Paenibacillus nasutitermitis]